MKYEDKTMRKLGMDIISEVPWGTHLCQFYQTKEDLIDILVPYFKAGLENNEFCMWVTAEPLKSEGAKKALSRAVNNLDSYIKNGQIEILDANKWYTRSGRFKSDEALQGWVEKENQIIKNGFDGLRITGNTFWLEEKDWNDFVEYEETINNVIRKHRIIATCSYSLDKCGASEIIDVVSNHQFALIRRHDKWELIESTERRQAEIKIARQNAVLDAVNQIFKRALTCNTLWELGETCLDVCEKLTKSKFGFIGELNSKGLFDTIAISNPGWDVSKMPGTDKTKSIKNMKIRGVDRSTLRGEKSRIVNDPASHPDRVGTPKGHPPITSFLGVPLKEAGKTIGMIGLGNKESGYDAADQGNVETLAVAIVQALRRKKAEKRLCESEEQYRLLAETAIEGIYQLDSSGNYVFMNETYAEMLGYKREELLGKNATSVIPELEREKATKMPEDIGPENPSRGEFTLKHKLGHEIPLYYSMVPQIKQGQITGFTGTIIDISERKKAEEKLRLAAEKWETTFNSITDLVSIQDKDFKIVKVNKAYADTFKMKPEELIGKACYEIIHGTKEPLLNCPHKQTLETKKTIVEEFFEPRLGIYLQISASPVFNDKGEIAGSLHIAKDITERKRAEEEIRESREILRNLTRHIQSIREEERSRIAREIHDDLGQKLTALKMDFSWLKRRLPKDQTVLHGKINSMLGLVDETIQTVQKVSTELRPSLLDNLGLAAAVEWQTEDFQKRTGIRCGVTLDPDDIIMDKERSTDIYRILQETLTNIIRHANASEVKVQLRKEDNRIVLEVRDNGKGITTEQITAPKSLGLVGIRERVRFWDGEVKMSGIPGKGTTVKVTILLDEQEKTNDKTTHHR